MSRNSPYSNFELRGIFYERRKYLKKKVLTEYAESSGDEMIRGSALTFQEPVGLRKSKRKYGWARPDFVDFAGQ
jgi:hypothetical protein